MSLVQYFTQINTEQSSNAFEDLYIDVRAKEGRVLTDSEVMFLPDVAPGHLHYTEWMVRRRSAQKLSDRLKKKGEPLRILEIGCGNGWLSAHLSTIPKAQVTGLDINRVETDQAKRVFEGRNLRFLYSYFEPGMFAGEKFDVIVFAASIQYFASFSGILQKALSCLSPHGEIHLIDSHFYKPAEVAPAAKRTLEYYKSLGYPEMAENYYHHTFTALQAFNYEVLFNPTGIFNHRNKKAPFYWFCITH